MGTTSLVCTDPARASEMWPHVAQLLATAFAKQESTYTLEEAHQEILAGASLLWIAWDDAERRVLGVATTKIIKDASGKILTITCAAGRELKRWQAFIADLEAYGIGEGCDKCRMSGRPGWLKVFPDYRQPWVTIEKDLARGG